jgi:hypothetical protein
MSSPAFIPFSTQTYQHRSPNVQMQRTLNFYPEADPNNSTNPILIGTAGTTTFCEIPVGSACRGVHTSATSRFFAVYGGTIYEIGFNGTAGYVVRTWSISGLNTNVSMADNGDYLVIVDTVSMYVINLNSNQLVPVDIQSDMQGPVQVIYLAGFFYAIDNTRRFYFSDINKGPLLWPGLNVAEAESSADALISMIKRNSDVVFFGPQSFEVWRISGNDLLPLVPVVTSNVGCASPDSVSIINDVVMFLGSNTNGTGMIFALSGNSAEPISNPAISFIIDQAGAGIESAYSCAYQQEGHSFYCLSFPSLEKTLCYDLTMGMWHERGSRDPLTNITQRWDVAFCAFAFGRILCGNLRSDNPAILTLDLNKYTEYDGRTIQRIHQAPIFLDGMSTLFFDALEIEMETGVGLQIGQGSEPVVMLDYSDDCHTWSSQLWAGMGRIGQYLTMVRFSRLGRSRNRVFRITITDPVKCVIRSARVWYTRGNSR